MKILISILIISSILSCEKSRKEEKSIAKNVQLEDSIPKDYQYLFNGENFENWTIIIDDKGNERDLFTIENGMIHTYKNQLQGSTQSFGALITKKEYSNFMLQLEYKWGEKKFMPRDDFVRDAGVIFHMHGEDIIWPNGVECQIQEGDTGDLWAIGTRVSSKVQPTIRNYAPNGELITRGNTEKRFQRFHRGYFWEKSGWNKVVIEVKGAHAKFFINDKLVNEAIDMEYWDTSLNIWQPLMKGKILLQAEGAEIFYRNIFIKEI